jgi:hypothetical protein
MSNNIHWRKIPADATVRLHSYTEKNSCFVYVAPDGAEAVVNWGSNDAAAAQQFLNWRVGDSQ